MSPSDFFTAAIIAHLNRIKEAILKVLKGKGNLNGKFY